MRISSYTHKKHCMLAALAAIVSLLSSGCTQYNEPDTAGTEGDENCVVAFGAYVSNMQGTRASESDFYTLKQSGFGVFASLTWNEDFQDNPSGDGTTANYMYNQKVEWQEFSNGNGGWGYQPERLWPGNNKVSFFAYAPYSDGVTSGIILPERDTPGSPRLDIKLGSEADRNVDILYAKALNLVNSPEVPLTFHHALARISVNLSTDNIDSNSKLEINKMSFKSANIGTRGKLNLNTGEWEVISDYTDLKIEDIEALKKGFMIIPTASEVNNEIMVDYTVITVDDKLTSGRFECKNAVTKQLSIKFEAGKSYNLNLKVKLNSVDIDVNVKDWDDENHKWESDENHNMWDYENSNKQ